MKPALLSIIALCAIAAERPPSREVISELKELQRQLGFEDTRNFRKNSGRAHADYRCYYTGRLELPDSYIQLRLAKGSSRGCRLDENKYDVFFYPIEAVASGDAPVTTSLEQAPVERFLVVVPHEDFHEDRAVQRLPELMAEAASTLIGFLTASEYAQERFARSEVSRNLAVEAGLFLRKAEIVNRYHARLTALYQSQSAAGVLSQKQELFTHLERECEAISPEPSSFHKCLSAYNNAGLAFEHSYTKHYPLFHQLYVTLGRDLRKTIDTIRSAPPERIGNELEAVRYFRERTISVTGYEIPRSRVMSAGGSQADKLGRLQRGNPCGGYGRPSQRNAVPLPVPCFQP